MIFEETKYIMQDKIPENLPARKEQNLVALGGGKV